MLVGLIVGLIIGGMLGIGFILLVQANKDLNDDY